MEKLYQISLEEARYAVKNHFDQFYLAIVGTIGEKEGAFDNLEQLEVTKGILKEREQIQNSTEYTKEMQEKFLEDISSRLNKQMVRSKETTQIIWKKNEQMWISMHGGMQINLENVYIRALMPLSFYCEQENICLARPNYYKDNENKLLYEVILNQLMLPGVIIGINCVNAVDPIMLYEQQVYNIENSSDFKVLERKR